MNYAYARVSAKDQNLQRQIAAFSEFGIEKSRIFSDYPDGHGDDGENTQKMPENEKETDKAVSDSDINAECAYTSRLVEMGGLVRSFATEQRLPGVRKGARPFGAQPVPCRHNKNRTETRSAFVVEQ